VKPSIKKYLISILAPDAIGLIHSITRTIAEIGGDLTDTRQQVLQGYFSMILYGSFPGEISSQTIREQLLNINPEQPFEVSIKPAPKAQPANPVSPDSYVLTARGEDRRGFVALVSGFCAEQNINILDLSTTGKGKTYTMILLVDLSNCPDTRQLRSSLEQFNRTHNLSLLLQHHDIFKATNEIIMR